MPRLWFRFLGAMLILPLRFLSALVAQDATPASPVGDSVFVGLDLPTLDLTVTATTCEGIPDEVDAGPYVASLSRTKRWMPR